MDDDHEVKEKDHFDADEEPMEEIEKSVHLRLLTEPKKGFLSKGGKK
jgi:hypothetical protein